MQRSPSPRKSVNLSESLHRRLNSYAVAASAAGVAALALTPAQARIVYTPAHVTLQVGKPYALDLNHDGITDFFLLQMFELSTNYLSACRQLFKAGTETFCYKSATGQNVVRVIESLGKVWGAALRPGAKIQRGDPFPNFAAVGLASSVPISSRVFGPWLSGGKGVKNRYLGMKFKIDGRFHFGWVRMTVDPNFTRFTTTLTGYAYETIPGKAIIAGQTKGRDVITVAPASLGHLAAGASALPAWRVKRTAITTH
jgi:hypothetical protein